MNFATPAFFGFLLILLALVYATKSPKRRKLLLLAASYIFYATWNVQFIALLLFSTTTDYLVSKRLALTTNGSKRKLLLFAGITINLLILGLFKYFNFFVDSANQTLGLLFHHSHAIRHLALILPLGISFYTFEAISYLVDVYRDGKPAPDFLDYNFYIMYFPHLISGPIVRYRELSPQITNGIYMPSVKRFCKGLELIVLGLVFKVIIADTAAGAVDPIFANLAGANICNVWIAWLAFTVQIYFDFMGYTHIARGASLLFNVELPLNFDHPYSASNISNFWQRWHISLSRWIRDYLFIPIGGSRGSSAKTAANLLFTMTIAGAWHGAAWTFIIWGAYHGLLLLLYHFAGPVRSQLQSKLSAYKTLRSAYAISSVGLTFLLVAFGWIWFRSPDIFVASQFVGKLCRFAALSREISAHASVGDFEFPMTFIILLLLCLSGPFVVNVTNKVRLSLPFWARAQFATAALVLCYIFAGAESKPFIYFQF